MLKAIKRITFYTVIFTSLFLVKTFNANKINSTVVSSETVSSNYNETSNNEIIISDNRENKDNASMYSQSEYSNSKQINVGITDSKEGIPGLAENKQFTYPSLGMEGLEAVNLRNDEVASNTFSNNDNGYNYSSNSNLNYGFSNNSGPNAGEAYSTNGSTEIGNTEASTNLYASASRTASSSNNYTTGSRVSPSGSLTPSMGGFSTPPIVEAPGSPGGGGGDPFVPIDDYYGLFALLLCSGVIYWYRMKASKLVGVKA